MGEAFGLRLPEIGCWRPPHRNYSNDFKKDNPFFKLLFLMKLVLWELVDQLGHWPLGLADYHFRR